MFSFHHNKEIASIYVLYMVSWIMSVIPHTTTASFGTVLVFVTFISIYILRNQSKEDSIAYSHYVTMIKTTWISSLMAVVGIVICFFMADQSVLNNMMQSAMSGIIPSKNQMALLAENYMRTNMFLFLAVFSPMLMYLFYRLGKGLYILSQGLPITNPRSWL